MDVLDGALTRVAVDFVATETPGHVRELFVDGDRAVIYVSQGGSGAPRCTYGYDCQFAGDGSQTTILVYDVSNRVHPRLVRRLDLSGSLLAARRMGSTVHTVVSDGDSHEPYYSTWPRDLGWCGTLERAVREKFERLAAENERRIRAAAPSLPTLTENQVQRNLCDSSENGFRRLGGIRLL